MSARDVITDETTTATVYEHDALGRLIQSTTGGLVAEYGWDAASNLVFESVSDDLSTVKTGDGYTATREVNALNQVVEIVTDPLALPASRTETTVMFYDVRGNRISEVTTTGNKTHTVSDVVYTYDGRDLLASTTGADTELFYERDGVGRALRITQDGQARTRLYDGVALVRDGDTAITRSASGAVLFETATTTTGQGKKQVTETVSVDVLTDMLGSAVATAEGGLIDADLALFGDFGNLLTAPDAVTVTGFTGQVQMGNLLEFATRTYDIDTRVWLQDDAYRGTVVRASSLNRYAYVEGAPETYVDKLGFFRAAAALHAQQVAAAKAAYEKAKAAYEAAMEAKKSYYTSTVSVPGLQTMPRYVFDSLFDTQAALDVHLEREKQKRLQAYRDYMDVQISHLYAQSPGGDPNVVHEDRGFVGNRLEALKGFGSGLWDMGVGLFDMTVATSPQLQLSGVADWTGSNERFAQQVQGFMAGVEQNGVWDQVNITFNPVYHIIDGAASAHDAYQVGDYYGVGEGSAQFTAGVVSTALIAVPTTKIIAPRIPVGSGAAATSTVRSTATNMGPFFEGQTTANTILSRATSNATTADAFAGTQASGTFASKPRFIVSRSGQVLDLAALRIPQGKYGYLLENASKAGVFKESMGFNAGQLEYALIEHLRANFRTATDPVPIPGGGSKFQVRGPMTGPSGQSWNITTVWAIEQNGTIRLVTATP